MHNEIRKNYINMKQNNQNSTAVCLRKLFTLCFALLVAVSAFAEDKLTVLANIKAGTTQKIALSLNNETAYTAFQMEITLPKGLTIASEGAMTIASARNANHQVFYNQLESGIIRVASLSFDSYDNPTTGNEAFTGNSGDLLIIEVTAADDYVPANITAGNILFVKKSDLAEVTLNAEQGLLGDVNGDGEVTVLDGLAIIDCYLKKNPTPFDITLADIDHDGEITVLDALATIDIYLKK